MAGEVNERHCEEQRDEAIRSSLFGSGLFRFAPPTGSINSSSLRKQGPVHSISRILSRAGEANIQKNSTDLPVEANLNHDNAASLNTFPVANRAVARIGAAAIVHCSGSAGTQAGLVVGGSMALSGTRIVGIDFDAEPERVRADVVRYAKAAADLLDTNFSEADVEVVAGYAGPAYGVPHSATIEAIKLAGALEVLPVDPVYSGKGVAGFIALIRAKRWQPNEDVIFVHTGGAPALFAYQSALSI